MIGTLVIVQTTPFCNIDCKYCYLPNRNKTKHMSLVLLEKIFDGILSSHSVMDPVRISYHAGEPLAVPKAFYKDASRLLRKYSEFYGREVQQNLQTNATLIDREWATIFKQNGIRVGVSIDGPQFIHDRNRVTRKGLPTHDKVMKGVRILQQEGVNFTVIMVLTKFALDYPDEIYNFFVDNGIKHVGFNIDEFGANQYVSSYDPNSDWLNTLEKYKSFMKRLMERVDSGGGQLVIREFTKAAAFISRIAVEEGEYANGPNVNGGNVPMSVLNFDVNGNYTTFSPELLDATSAKYGNFHMGNILHQKVDSIFENSNFQIVNQEIQKGVASCKQSCRYFEFCGGGFPADKFYELGRFDVTETINCRVQIKTMFDVCLEYLQTKLTSQAVKPSL